MQRPLTDSELRSDQRDPRAWPTQPGGGLANEQVRFGAALPHDGSQQRSSIRRCGGPQALLQFQRLLAPDVLGTDFLVAQL